MKFQMLTQRTNSICIDKNFSKALKKIYFTNKTNAYDIDVTLSLDEIILMDYGPENIRSYR